MADSQGWDFPNPATPVGSAGYYICRFSKPMQRERLARLFAWAAHLQDIAERANDPGVARLKLDWWRDELIRILADEPRHPLAIALAADINADWQRDAMLAMLDATEQRILKKQPQSHAEFISNCQQQGGAFAELLCGNDDHVIRQQARNSGAGHTLTGLLQNLGHDIRNDYCALPAEILQKYSIGRDMLQATRPIPSLASLCEELLRSHAAPSITDASLAPVQRMNAQAGRLIQKLRRRQFPLNQRHIELNPLQLLWAAWRMR